MRRALYGVKQMKEVMWRNGQKHEHLMKSLQRSSDKKKVRQGHREQSLRREENRMKSSQMINVSLSCHQGAAELAKEVTEKLEEAEEQCKDSLQSEWEECRPCLEDACKTFYTSTCRRGFATFHAKVLKLKLQISKPPKSQSSTDKNNKLYQCQMKPSLDSVSCFLVYPVKHM